MRFDPDDSDRQWEREARLDRDFEVEHRKKAYRPQNTRVAYEEASERLALKFALVEQDTRSSAQLEDEDGIDGPFDRAMNAAIAEDRAWRPSDAQQTASQVAAVDAAREANKLAETIATLLADTKSRRIRECVSELKDRAWELLTELEHGGRP